MSLKRLSGVGAITKRSIKRKVNVNKEGSLKKKYTHDLIWLALIYCSKHTSADSVQEIVFQWTAPVYCTRICTVFVCSLLLPFLKAWLVWGLGSFHKVIENGICRFNENLEVEWIVNRLRRTTPNYVITCIYYNKLLKSADRWPAQTDDTPPVITLNRGQIELCYARLFSKARVALSTTIGPAVSTLAVTMITSFQCLIRGSEEL